MIPLDYIILWESEDGGLIVMVDNILNVGDELIFCTKLY